MSEDETYLKAIEKIRKHADARKISLESIASAERLKAERKEKEKETRLFNIAQKEAERLAKERIENERKKLNEDAEMLKAKLLVDNMVKAEKEKTHGYIGKFTVKSTKITSDKRIRFSAPPEIKKGLEAGQRVRLEVKISTVED